MNELEKRLRLAAEPFRNQTNSEHIRVKMAIALQQTYDAYFREFPGRYDYKVEVQELSDILNDPFIPKADKDAAMSNVSVTFK